MEETANSIEALKKYIKEKLEEQYILSKLDDFLKSGKSSAGKKSKEEIFTREFLCPSLYDYFSSQLVFSDDDIKKGLGTEGYQNCLGFGFTPSHGRQHIFRKQDMSGTKSPPEWLKKNESKLPDYQPCPDFAIRKPLPVSVVGDVKYFENSSTQEAITMLYSSAREAVFYLGAFHGDYDSALIVVADGSKTEVFSKGMQSLKTDLLQRFGFITHIHLSILNLK